MRNTRRFRLGTQPTSRVLPLTGAIMTALLGLQAQNAGSQSLAAGALPTNGQVVLGTATITQSGNAMTVLQQSGKLITNWDSFNIGSAARVDFLQPSTSAMALNRVLLADPSRIYGKLNANGQLFLVNPAGVLFAPGSKVNAGGLVASALDISNADFAAGNFRFSGGSLATGEIANEGEITTPDKGYAALLGPRVRNAGSIVARMGTVALAAGNAVTLDLHGDSLINLQIDSAAAQALAANSGALRADGGLVVLATSSSGDPLATVLNNTGTIHSTTLANVNGVIRLEGGSNGVVSMSGTLDASGKGAGETGGTVKVLGDKVGLFDGARIDASGDRGGGTILVGGNWQGSGTEQRASAAFVGADAKLNADAISNGNGGKVVVWADGSTQYHGDISANGGAMGGNGGMVETSGKEWLEATGSASARAYSGSAGQWLLDPSSVTITTTTSGGSITAGVFTPTGTSATVNAATINTALSGGTSVIINTDSAQAQVGDITVSSNVLKNGGGDATLTLLAGRNINVGANITSNTGKLNVVLNAARGGLGAVSIGAGSSIITNGGNLTIGGGTDPSTMPAIGNITSGSIQSGVRMQGGGALLSTGNGNIIINGTGAASSTITSVQGMLMNGSGSNTIETVNGNITINALSPIGSGMSMGSATNTIQSTGTGNININATSEVTTGSFGLSMGTDGTNKISVKDGTATIVAKASGTGGALSMGSGTNTIEATGTGSLSLTGQGLLSGNGVSVGSGTNLIAAKSGSITLVGSTTSGANNGISFGTADGTSTVRTETGNISISGTAGGSGSGIRIAPDTTTATIEATGSGNITLSGDSFNVAPTGTGSVLINGNGGTLLIQPLTDSRSIGIGGATGGLQINNTLTSAINGFSSVTVGRASGTGAIAVNAATVRDNLVIRQASGGITFAGALAMGGNNLSISSGGGAISGVQATGAGNVNIAGAGALSFGNLTATGMLAAAANGAITQTGGSALTVTGATTLASGTGNDITLAETGNNFSSVGITSARNVSLSDSGALQMNSSSVSGTLALITVGAITQGAGSSLAVGGATSLTAGSTNNIVLTEAGNNFSSVAVVSGNNVALRDVNALQLGSSTISGTLDVTAAGAVTQGASAISVTGVTTINAGASDVTLDQAGNNFSSIGVTGGNVSLRDSNALQMDTTSAASLTVTAGGPITQTASSSVTVTGATTLAAGANAITLAESSNNFSTVTILNGGNVSLRDTNALVMAASTVSGDLSLRADGLVSQSGVLNIAGGLNVTTGQVAGDVAVNNSGAATTVLGNTSIGNNYTLTTAGDILQQGGTSLIIGNNFSVSGGTLTAPSAGNVIGGTDNSSGSGTSIRQVGVIDLSTRDIGSGAGNITTGGNLSVQSLASADTIQAAVGAGTTAVNLNLANNIGGAIAITSSAPTVTPSGTAVATGITQNGAVISVGGSASFSAAVSSANAGGVAGNITLDGTGNVFAGPVSFSGHNVLVNSGTALAIGTGSATGTLALRAATGGITAPGALVAAGDAIFTADEAGASITLGNAANNFGGTVSFAGAGGLGSVTITDNTALDLQALTLSGNLTARGAGITDSGALSIGGATTLASTGTVVLDNAGHAFTGPVSVTATGADIRAGGVLQLGASNITGDLALTAGGAITQSGALAVGGNLTLTTTHAAGDVAINNSGAATTKLGSSTIGGDYTVTGNTVTQNSGSAINVAGDFNITAASTTTSPADNLVGGSDNTQGVSTFIKQVGVVTLGNLNTAGNLTVISQAVGQAFNGPAVHGQAITLSNAGNNIGGTVTVTTAAPSITSTGAPVATGIQQAAGTSVQVGGTTGLTAVGGNITMANTGNSFTGAVSATGNNVSLRTTGALVLGAISAAQFQATAGSGIAQNASGMTAAATTLDGGAGAIILNTATNDFTGTVALANTSGAVSLTDANTLSLGTVNAAGALTITAGGITTLNGNVSGTGVSFAGAGAGAVTLATDVTIDGRTGNIALGAMTGGARNLTLNSGTIALSGNWTGTGAYALSTNSDATTIGLGDGAAGTWNMTTAELANISNASASLVTIGRATGTGAINVNAMAFDDALKLQGGLTTFAAGGQTFGNGLTVASTSRISLAGATLTATGGNIALSGSSTATQQAVALSGGTVVRTTSGNITIDAVNSGGSAFGMGAGTNTVDAGGSGNVTINGTATGGTGFGLTIGGGGTNTIRSANGNVSIEAKSAGSSTAISLGSGANTITSTGAGNVSINATATGTVDANGLSMGTSGANTISTAGGGITIIATSALGSGMSMGTGTNSVVTGGGAISVQSTGQGASAALSLVSGTNTIEATQEGSVAIAAANTGTGNGIAMGTSGTSNIRTASGDINISAQSAQGSGLSMASGSNAITTGGGNIAIQAAGNAGSPGMALSNGSNLVRAGGAGNLTIDASSATSSGLSLGSASSTAGTSVLSVSNGVLTINATGGGASSALTFGVGSSATLPATNTVEASLGGSVNIHAVNTATGNGITMGSGSNNTIRTGAGSLTVVAESAGGTGMSMATGNNQILSGGGGVSVTGIAHGNDNGMSMGSTAGASTNLIAASGTGNLSVSGTSEGTTTGFGFSMGTGSNNTLRVEDGVLTVRGQSAGQGDSTVTAVAMGSGTNTVEATGAGRIDIAGNALGAGNGFSIGTGGTNTVRTVSGALDLSGKAAGSGHGVNMGSGVNTVQSASGAVNITGAALGSGNGFYVSSTGRDSVLTDNGSISITGSSATGDAIAIRPTADVATIEATGAGNVTFRADNYDATPSGTGSVRIASNGGELRILQVTPGTTIGIGEGAQGTLNWSGAEVTQASGFSLVRIGNSESGALDLRPPWFPFSVVRPPIRLSATQQVLNETRTTVESLLSYANLMSIGELPPTLAVTRRFNLLVQGFDNARR